jgi:hypothetical protein
MRDLGTAILYASGCGETLNVHAEGGTAAWPVFAPAVNRLPVALRLENVPRLQSSADEPRRSNVPGMLCAGCGKACKQ